MKRQPLTKRLPDWAKALLCLLVAAALLPLYYHEPTKALTFVAGAGILVLLAVGKLERLRNLPTILLLGYVAFAMITILWAMSGKFFLQQYTKIFIAAACFLWAALYPRPGRSFARGVMGVLAGVIAGFSAIGILAAAIPALQTAVRSVLPGSGGAFQYSGRMWSVFGNSNIEAAFYALGTFCSLGVLCDTEDGKKRAWWAAALYLNAISLLLGFSMGALICFALSVVVYLLFAGAGRAAALPRMIQTAVVAVVCGVLMVHFFGAGQGAVVIALLVLGTAASVALELRVTERLRAILEPRQKLVFGILIALVVLLAGYVLLSMRVSAPYTFGGALARDASLAPGEHTLAIEADGAVSVKVESYTHIQIVAGGQTELYDGPADGARFTVPEDSYLCNFTFTGEDGVTLSRATVDGSKNIVLRQKLMLPFLANRLSAGVGSRANSAQRLIYLRDGFRLAMFSPIGGNGVGCFETGCTAVQEYYYATRYVHNHYLQVFMDTGIIGFALFFGALVTLGIALFRRYREKAEGELRRLYPALCAAFIMNCLHMLWDSQMSIFLFTCITFALYGVIVSLYAEPLAKKETAPAGGKKKAAPQRSDFPVRLALMLLPVFFMLSIAGNIYANKVVASPHESYNEAYATMENAVKLDLYEKNDIKLSYLLTVQDDEEFGPEHYPQADKFAEELSRVQSNRLPGYLTMYYYNTSQYSRAIDEAILGATYSASDEEQWETIIDYLRQGFIDAGWASPLLGEDGDELLDKLLEYKAMREAYDARSPKPLSLSDSAEDFFARVAALDACRGDTDAMLEAMLGERDA